MIEYGTLTEAFAAAVTSDKSIAFIEGADEMTTITRRGLHTRALRVLGVLQAGGLRPGDEVVIYLDHNQNFLEALWACLFGGLIPVPVSLGISDEHRLRLLRIFSKLDNPTLYSDSRTLDRLEQFSGKNSARTDDVGAELERVRSRSILVDDQPEAAGQGDVHDVKPGDVALIQFSSGSTSEPKGIVLTHANILSNLDGIRERSGLSASSSTLSWMPLTHDMGLIGFHLFPVVRDLPSYLMPTSLFIRRPLLWLQKASAVNATTLCSPNFGYEHFLKAADKHGEPELELSQVELIFNGAEPISIGLCRRFLERMARFGLRASSMYPAYGMAEASVAVSLPRGGTGLTAVCIDRRSNRVGQTVEFISADDPQASAFAGVGTGVKGCEVRITGDDHSVLPENTVGHIEIRGDCVTGGYYRDEEANRTARREGGWLDTGDLGFFADSGLVITGRSKEIIFAHGQNFYPHDLESIIHRECGIALGKVVVAGHRPDGADGDQLLVYMIHKGALSEFAPIAVDIKAKLNTQTGLEAAYVIPVSKIPKTTSGKVQRHLMIRAHAGGEYADTLRELEGLEQASQGGRQEDLTEVEAQLKAVCDSVIPDKRVKRQDNLFEIGTSSLELAQIHEGIEKAYPNHVDVTDLFDYPTIRELAVLLEKKLADR